MCFCRILNNTPIISLNAAESHGQSYQRWSCGDALFQKGKIFAICNTRVSDLMKSVPWLDLCLQIFDVVYIRLSHRQFRYANVCKLTQRIITQHHVCFCMPKWAFIFVFALWNESGITSRDYIEFMAWFSTNYRTTYALAHSPNPPRLALSSHSHIVSPCPW